jgi:hypothetical protein
MDAPLCAATIANGVISVGDVLGNIHFFRANAALRGFFGW